MWRGGGWNGGWGWSGGWRGVGWNGGWGGVGWNGGWGGPVGWGGGWGPAVWTRRSVMFVQPTPVFYSSPVIYGGGFDSGCGWYGDTTVINPGIVSIGPPAVYAPAGIAYGPDAVKEFMGVDRDFAKGPLVASSAPIIVRDTLDGGARVVGEGRRVERVASHPDAKLRAVRFIGTGDAEFGEQQYHAAAQRYREAAVAAPDVADAFFRQGFAYIASNRFDLAAKSFRRGLELDPLWVNSSFRIDELYGRNQLAKNSHLEVLARSALAERDSDKLFLIALMLHFDGQTVRAKKFFTHAEKYAAGDDAHIQAFLVPPAPAAEDAV